MLRLLRSVPIEGSFWTFANTKNNDVKFTLLQTCVVTIRNQQSWVISEIHQIGGAGNSFCLFHFYTTCYCSTKAAKALHLHTSSSYWQKTQKSNN